MENEIKEQIEAFVQHCKSQYIPLDTIKYILITKFNKKSLIYRFICTQYLTTYVELVKRMGLGTYDKETFTLRLNLENDYIDILMNKYRCFDKKEVVLTPEEKKVLNL